MATEFGFVSPVSFPVLLSANYGELRGNHFHSGIDVKTQGVINKPIRAIADGTVVRIAVSPSGFGKALIHKSSEWHDERLRSPGTFFGLDRAVYP